MSRAVLGEFEHADTLMEALHAAREEGAEVADVFSPYPLPEASHLLAPDRMRVRWWAAATALATGAMAWVIQWWSAAYAYPLNTGSRPLNSWPVYVLTVFEVSVLAAAIGGVIAFLILTGLPRLNHPAFDIEELRRASQDRFFLALAAPGRDERLASRLVDLLNRHGACRAREVEL